ELPLRSFPAKYLGDSQGPVLFGYVSDLAVHAFDRHENGQIARLKCRDQFLFQRSALEELRHPRASLRCVVEPAHRSAAERIHQQIVLRMAGQLDVLSDVAANQRLVRFLRPQDEAGEIRSGTPTALSSARAHETERSEHDSEEEKEAKQIHSA